MNFKRVNWKACHLTNRKHSSWEKVWGNRLKEQKDLINVVPGHPEWKEKEILLGSLGLLLFLRQLWGKGRPWVCHCCHRAYHSPQICRWRLKTQESHSSLASGNHYKWQEREERYLLAAFFKIQSSHEMSAHKYLISVYAKQKLAVANQKHPMDVLATMSPTAFGVELDLHICPWVPLQGCKTTDPLAVSAVQGCLPLFWGIPGLV